MSTRFVALSLLILSFFSQSTVQGIRHERRVGMLANDESPPLPEGQAATDFKVVVLGKVDASVPKSAMNLEGPTESWVTEDNYLVVKSSGDDNNPAVLSYAPAIGNRDFSLIANVMVKEGPRGLLNAQPYFSLNTGGGDQKLIFFGANGQLLASGSHFGTGGKQQMELGQTTANFGIVGGEPFVLRLERKKTTITFSVNGHVIPTEVDLNDGSSQIMSFGLAPGFADAIAISDLRIYVTSPRNYMLDESHRVLGSGTLSVEYPEPGYGSPEKGVSLDQCKDACDAQTKAAPKCDAIVYDIGAGSCTLWSGYAASRDREPADETEDGSEPSSHTAIYYIPNAAVPNTPEGGGETVGPVPTGADAATAARMSATGKAVFDAMSEARQDHFGEDPSVIAEAVHTAAIAAEASVKEKFASRLEKDKIEEDDAIEATGATGLELVDATDDLLDRILPEAPTGATGSANDDNGSCPDECSGHGICDESIGLCGCFPGFSGESCAEECENRCSGHGRCWDGECLCDPGFVGDDCGKESPCPKGCSGHGECWNSECLCNVGWRGKDCAESVPCPEDCSGHGKCWNGACRCFPGFTGEGCGVAAVAPANECSNHGILKWGKCHCHAGYVGEHCETPTSCVRDCSERGVCVHGQCYCLPGATGPACGGVTSDVIDDEMPPSKVYQSIVKLSPSAVSQRLGMAASRENADKHAEHTRYAMLAGVGFPREARIADPPATEFEATDARSCGRRCGAVLGCAAATWSADTKSCTLFCSSVWQIKSDDDQVTGLIVRPNADLCGVDWRGTGMLPFVMARLDEGCPGSPACGGNGLCIMGQCVCRQGFVGTGCQRRGDSGCPKDCSGRGVCQNQRCECVPGAAGDDCSQNERCGRRSSTRPLS